MWGKKKQSKDDAVRTAKITVDGGWVHICAYKDAVLATEHYLRLSNIVGYGYHETDNWTSDSHKFRYYFSFLLSHTNVAIGTDQYEDIKRMYAVMSERRGEQSLTVWRANFVPGSDPDGDMRFSHEPLDKGQQEHGSKEI